MSNFIDVAEQLGPDGSGYSLQAEAITRRYLEPALQELQEAPLPWWPQYNSFTNARGITVHQAFDVFAHKFSRGSQKILEHIPALHSLTDLVIATQVDPLAKVFPSLRGWEPDELSIQRYPRQDGGLSFHKDLARHTGVIIICSLTGEAELHVKTQTQIERVACHAGDVLLLRAPGLFETTEDTRPEHAVSTVRGSETRISATLRANNKPNEPIPNFSYNNWPKY